MSNNSSGGRPIGRLLRAPDFRRLLGAQAISGLGDWMATVALMALIFELTGSAVAVGAMLAIRMGPGAIAGPLAAQAARRWDRRKTMLAMDLVRVAVVVAIPLVRNVGWVLVWVFVLESATLVYLPARDALVPDLVERRDLRVANGLVLGAQYGGLPVGAGLFAVFVTIAAGLTVSLPGGRLGPVFVADAVTFLGSYLLVRGVQPPAGSAGASDGQIRFRDALSISLVRSALIPMAAVAAGLGAVFSVGIVFVQDTLGASDIDFALLIILFGGGALLGLVLVQVIGSDDPFRDMRLGVLSLGIILALMGWSPTVTATLFGAVGFGAAAVASIVSAISGLQMALSEQQRILAFTSFHIAVRIALGIGALVAGGAADLLVRLGVVEPTRLVLGGAGVLVAVGVGTVWGRLDVPTETK
jgi:predicted MFS family arabinose efflux permease